MAKKCQDTIITDSEYTIPFDIWDRDSACALFEFYLYNMANEKDSPLSYKLDTSLSDEQKSELLTRLLNSEGADESSFICGRFLNNKLEEIVKLQLSDQSLNCDRVKGFLQSPDESLSIDILMKRIRDSFAHGRIARSKDEAFLILEDRTKQLTGRIVLHNDTLMKWRDIIVDYWKEIGLCPA